MSALDINLDTITTIEAKATLDRVIKQLDEQTNESALIAVDDLKVISYAVENNLQLRDYLLGLTVEGLTVESMVNILELIIAMSRQEDLATYPLETVLAAYLHQLSDPTAVLKLSSGLERDYPLAKLLLRVINAGWPSSAFATMSEELHPKVVAKIEAESGELANESLRVAA